MLNREQASETFLEYKSLLFSIAYNMLGNVDAAEDMVQDTFLRWMEKPVAEVKHRKAYLVKMVTNKSINYMNSARAQRESYVGIWLPEPLRQDDAEALYKNIELYHTLSLGIMVLLEKLTPQERAIFLLKEVFGYDYYELADMFEKTEDNCRQIFKRAKDHLGKDTRRFAVDIQAHEKMLERFVMAVSEGSMESLVELLKEDITLFADGGGHFISVNRQRLTSTYKPIYGQENVCRLLLVGVPKLYQGVPDLRREVVIVNGLPSLVTYEGSVPLSMVSIETDGRQIRNIYVQTNPDKLRRFVQFPSE